MGGQVGDVELFFDIIAGSKNGALRAVRACLTGKLRRPLVRKPSNQIRASRELLCPDGEHCCDDVTSLKLKVLEARGLDALRMNVAVVLTGGVTRGKRFVRG